jgi:hypothetical protein
VIRSLVFPNLSVAAACGPVRDEGQLTGANGFPIRFDERPPRWTNFRFCIFGLLLTAPSLSPAMAKQAVTEGMGQAGEAISFAIPSESLAIALEAYSVRSGVQVLYDSALAIGRRSAAIDGVLSSTAALDAMLVGTDLTAGRTATGDIILLLASGAEIPEPIGSLPNNLLLTLGTLHVDGQTEISGRPDYRDYAALVQSDIQKVLRKDIKTRRGPYRIGVNLWIDNSGNVSRLEISRSTGDQARDEAVSYALHDFVLSKAPPRGMPQPVHVLIVVQGS